jgi:hypothetical protein
MHVDQIWSGQLLDGLPGTNQTLDWMAALVRRDAKDLQLRQCALEIVSSCGGHEFDCEIEALYNFVQDIPYRRDPVQVEWVQDAKRTLFTFNSGDCDDKVVALATLLACLGHYSRFVVLGRTREKYTHVYLEVATKKGWLPLDPTPEQASAGWQAQGAIRSTYEIFSEGRQSPVPLIAFGILLWWFLK